MIIDQETLHQPIEDFRSVEWGEDPLLATLTEPEDFENNEHNMFLAVDDFPELQKTKTGKELVVQKIPALSVLEPVLPAIIETVNSYEDNSLHIKVAKEAIVEMQNLFIELSTEEIADVFQNEQLIKSVTKLAVALNLDPKELTELLKIKNGEKFDLHLAEEILLGLQKVLSIEYSDEFKKHSTTHSTQNSDINVTHTIGQLLLRLFNNNLGANTVSSL